MGEAGRGPTMWTTAIVGMLWAMLGQGESASDVVTLKDGTVARGLVVNPDERGQLVLVVRRAWAEAEIPEKAKAWRAAEAPWMARARAERLDRLKTWVQERKAASGTPADDSIAKWVEPKIAELEALGPDQGLPTLLMTAIDRREVKSVSRRPPEISRLLRLGWRSGFADVETMPRDDLKQALQGRGFAPDGDEPVSLAAQLPTPIETDARWLARRAATEILRDGDGARFVRYGGFVAPEGQAGAAMDPMSLISGMLGSTLGGDLSGLGLGDLSGLGLDLGGVGAPRAPAADPIESKLREVAAKGRVGAVLTRLEISPDLAGVRVESTLLARLGPDRWEPVATRSATVRTDELAAGAGANIAADPQVQAIFQATDQLGLGIAPEMKQRALAIGTATQTALGRARAALQDDLEGLGLEQ